MISDLGVKMLQHLVCLVQWIAFALVQGAFLGRGKAKRPLLWVGLGMLGMLVLSLWVNFGYFNPVSIAANTLYLLVTSLVWGGSIRQKLVSCVINGVMCLLAENAVAYLYSLWADIPVSQVLDVPGGAAVVAAVMLAAGLLTARLAKGWGKKQMLEPLQMAVAMFFPGVVVVLNIVLMVAGGRLDATRFAVLFTAGLTAAVLVHLMFVQMLNEQVVQRKDSEYQARLEQERAEALLDSYTTQRRLTHEFTNHTEALSLMLQQGDVEGAKAYLADVGRTIQANTAILNSHNPLLDALLSKKYEEAARRGVMMYFDLSDLRDIPLENTELVIVISNLLNNAIDAAAKAAPPEVHVRIRQTPAELLLSVRNRVEKNVPLTDGQLPRSTKREPGHGMGLANVQEVLARHGAEFALSCRENWFRFTCAVPNRPNDKL